MAEKTLCIRTFGEAVRKHMNKKATVKIFGGTEKFYVTGQKTVNASGIHVFYTLLLESLTHVYEINGATGLPDIRKQLTTNLKNGKVNVPSSIITLAQDKKAAEYTSTCFAINLIPNIPKDSLSIVLDAVLEIIQQDSSLGGTKKASFLKWRKGKSEADFLAEAFVMAIRVGNNLLDNSSESADELTPLLRDINELKEKLDKIPRLKVLAPPDDPENHERDYIAALMAAYDDAVDSDTLPSLNLAEHPKFEKDYKQRRIEYFAAESVRRGTRENFRASDPDHLFEILLDEIYQGIVDVFEMDYKHGFERLLHVMQQASALPLASLLASIPTWVGPNQKKGICHMLVNLGRIEKWVIEDG